MLAEYFAGGLNRSRLRLLAGRVVAVRCLIDGASFIETFRELNRKFGFEQHTAFMVTMRVFRSGGFYGSGANRGRGIQPPRGVHEQ